MSKETWKLEKDLCRCCHSEGSFKNLSEPACEGQEEVLTDMLQFTLDINMSPVAGLLCFVTYTICEACLERLKDATNFKRQVLQCEERFRDMYDRDVIKVLTVGDFCVKEEVTEQDQDVEDVKTDEPHIDTEDNNDFANYDDDMKSETEVREDTGKRTKKTKQKNKTKKKLGRPKKRESIDVTGDGEKKGDETNYINQYTLTNGGDGTKHFVCNTCSRVYKKIDHFKQHYRHVHLKLRPKLRSCYLCDVKVPGHMRALHMEQAHGVPAPICNACGKKFPYPNQVLRHQKEDHMGEKKFTCTKCPMRFATRPHLKQHEIKHTTIRSYKCEYCEKAFKWKKNLTTHVMMHLDDRRHICSVCNEAFVQQTSLKYHITRRHPELV